MKKAKAKLAILVVLSLLLECAVLLRFIGNLSPRNLAAREVGAPIVTTQDYGNVSSSITQIVADESKIYLVYGYISVVRIYSLDGEYQYTLSVYNHNNGRTEIGVKDGILYIRDKNRNVYLFSGTEYIEFWSQSDRHALPTNLSFGDSTPNYSVKAGSIWYGADDTDSHCVIRRSGFLTLYQNNASELLALLFLILIGVVLRFPFSNKKNAP